MDEAKARLAAGRKAGSRWAWVRQVSQEARLRVVGADPATSANIVTSRTLKTTTELGRRL